MDLRNVACSFNDRWDRLYEQAKANEQHARKHLNPWFTYRDKLTDMEQWIGDVEKKVEIKITQFKTTDELKIVLAEEKVFIYCSSINEQFS